MNVAVLVVFAITSMGVYGIVLAGWSSNSKYSLLGGLRSSAQMISYELSYGLALASVIMLAGTLSLREIVMDQAGTWWHVIPRWYIFLQPLGFLIFLTAGVAETNRAPFDFPEAEQELVAGYHTEYSSMSFGLFFLAEYVNMVTVSAVATSLFLGGLARAAAAGLARLDLVHDQDPGDSLLLRVDALDAAALPVRPADGVRLEMAAARGGAEPDRDGGAGHLVGLMDLIVFYVFAALAVVASLGVIGQRNTMHSVMLLIVSFAALAGLYILLDAPFSAVTQIIIYAGRDHGALPLRRDAAQRAHARRICRPPSAGAGGGSARCCRCSSSWRSCGGCRAWA